MKKTGVFLLGLMAFINTFPQDVLRVQDPVEWINPLMGTDSKPSLSNGNTYPSICLPWGMNFWVPQTGMNGNGWVYQYNADKIRGFKQTHQPSPWMNDYGMFSLMPVTKQLKFTEEARASWFLIKRKLSSLIITACTWQMQT